METRIDSYNMLDFRATCPYTSEPDSDLETPHLSEALTETENDTPPETPLRPTMIGDLDYDPHRELKDQVMKTSGTLDMPYVQQTSSPVMPPPAQMARPLTIATPAPIRPAFYSFRSCGAIAHAGSLEEDGGYDSENEGQPASRPALPRTRSFRLTPNSDQGRLICSPRTGFSHRAASFAKRLQEHSPSPLSTPTLGSRPFDNATPPVTRHPLHPPPLPTDISTLLTDPQTVLSRGLGNGFTVIGGLDQVADVGTIVDNAAHWAQTEDFMLALEESSFLTEGSAVSPRNAGLVTGAPENRSSEEVGLGLGLPTGLGNLKWNQPTTISVHSGESGDNMPFPTMPPEWLQTPNLAPIREDDSGMSPLELSMPLIPASEEHSHWAALAPIDDSLWRAVETGLRNDDMDPPSLSMELLEPASARIILEF